jgi:hypothetical protein
MIRNGQSPRSVVEAPVIGENLIYFISEGL